METSCSFPDKVLNPGEKIPRYHTAGQRRRLLQWLGKLWHRGCVLGGGGRVTQLCQDMGDVQNNKPQPGSATRVRTQSSPWACSVLDILTALLSFVCAASVLGCFFVVCVSLGLEFRSLKLLGSPLQGHLNTCQGFQPAVCPTQWLFLYPVVSRPCEYACHNSRRLTTQKP